MQYNGIELTEMLPETWDGNSRYMFVWCDDTTPKARIVCGYDPIHCVWLVTETQDTETPEVWKHCAEIPKVEVNHKQEDVIVNYKGTELIEMTRENWDGKTRKMLVWCKVTDAVPYRTGCHIKTVIGYHTDKLAWVVSDNGLDYWPHCADIPTEDIGYSIDDLLKAITTRCEVTSWRPFESSVVEYLKSVKTLTEENGKLKTEIDDLKNSSSYLVYREMCHKKEQYENQIANLNTENEELKAKIKSLRAERVEMANTVSSAVWKELMERAAKQGSIIGVQMPNGFGFNDISDVVLNQILNYKAEKVSSNEGTYRPYDSVDEFLGHWNGMTYRGSKEKPGIPGVWLRSKLTGNDYMVTGLGNGQVMIDGVCRELDKLYKCYEYIDGTPFGLPTK